MITNHLWQSTWFAVAAGLLAWALRKNRAAVRYWLWFSASVKFLVPFAVLMGWGSRLEWATAAREIATPAVSLAVEQIVEPFPVSVPFVAAATGATDWRPAVLFGLWTSGFTVIGWIRLRGWLRIRDAVRASTPVEMAAAVEVRSAPGLIEPGVVGWLRPILLLPAGIEQRLPAAQLAAVLAHELSHVRRRDNVTAAIHMAVEAVFWFHPLVWWVGAKLVEERERACDEEVLRLGSEPSVYAEGIVNVCKLYVESPLRCVPGVTGSDLKRRIEAIMMNRGALRLNFARKAALAAAGIAALAAPVFIGMMHTPVSRAQPSAGSIPKFEVAAIRPCQPGDFGGKGGGRSKGGRGGPSYSPGRLSTICMPLSDSNHIGLIQRAYVRYAEGRARAFGLVEIEGGPAWIRSELYRIEAKAEGTPSQEMMEGPMLQRLLEDRFKLKVRRETREVPVYELTVGKDGPKLTAFQEGSCLPPPVPPAAPLAAGQRYCGNLIAANPPAVRVQGATLAEFCQLLNLVLDRPVIDKTGISGKFEIDLKFSIDRVTDKLRTAFDLGPPPAEPDPDRPSIFTAIKQFGLKLDSGKGPHDYLIIDHVERPSAN